MFARSNCACFLLHLFRFGFRGCLPRCLLPLLFFPPSCFSRFPGQRPPPLHFSLPVFLLSNPPPLEAIPQPPPPPPQSDNENETPNATREKTKQTDANDGDAKAMTSPTLLEKRPDEPTKMLAMQGQRQHELTETARTQSPSRCNFIDSFENDVEALELIPAATITTNLHRPDGGCDFVNSFAWFGSTDNIDATQNTIYVDSSCEPQATVFISRSSTASTEEGHKWEPLQDFTGAPASFPFHGDWVFVRCGRSGPVNFLLRLRPRPDLLQLLSQVSRTSSTPTSVLWIVIDAVSRAHLGRALPSTVEFLREGFPQSLFHSFEPRRYHALGARSPANKAPMFSGLSIGEVKRMMKNSESLAGERRPPWLWELAESQGYATMLSEWCSQPGHSGTVHGIVEKPRGIPRVAQPASESAPTMDGWNTRSSHFGLADVSCLLERDAGIGEYGSSGLPICIRGRPLFELTLNHQFDFHKAYAGNGVGRFSMVILPDAHEPVKNNNNKIYLRLDQN